MAFEIKQKKEKERENYEMEDTISMDSIKSLNQSRGYYFFSKRATRFFKSSYPKYAYKKDGYAYFVTGETNPSGETKFTIRKCNLESGDILTVGDFHDFNSRWEAEKEMKKYLEK
jgi:hypothetical protein